MKKLVFLLTLMATILLPTPVQSDNDARLYTPKPGTQVRKAICDAMRKYVRQMQDIDPKIKFLWKIDTMKVLGKYACFEGHAVKPDGSFFEDQSMIGDFVQMTFLRRNEDGWWVIADLTRTDVPSKEELKQIRGTFPAEVPTVIIPDFWKKKLR
ncbi:MAG: hypothetical protein KJO79_07215 [Verrucomicrobiae bacterium]|nr:hypothetical protein [Verrucomicrobiae bacterium]NNJ86951.1 hypothetical protein [Akkermansiaceae bacterium]